MTERGTLPPDKDRTAYWVKELTACYQKSVASIFALGNRLIECKRQIGWGKWLPLFESLPFSPDCAEKLMRIANNPVLSNSATMRILPASIETLYVLSGIDDSDLQEAIDGNEIDAETTVREARALYKRLEDGPPIYDGAIAESVIMQGPIDECQKIIAAVERIWVLSDLEKIERVVAGRKLVLQAEDKGATQ